MILLAIPLCNVLGFIGFFFSMLNILYDHTADYKIYLLSYNISRE